MLATVTDLAGIPSAPVDRADVQQCVRRIEAVHPFVLDTVDTPAPAGKRAPASGRSPNCR